MYGEVKHTRWRQIFVWHVAWGMVGRGGIGQVTFASITEQVKQQPYGWDRTAFV